MFETSDYSTRILGGSEAIAYAREHGTHVSVWNGDGVTADEAATMDPREVYLIIEAE